jgi:ABC-type transport system involved in cytochrome c biogenesis ATPase subunit
LHRDRWDDFGYGTTFYLVLDDSTATRHDIGKVKIGKAGMVSNGTWAPTVATPLEDEFAVLDETYFSVGQDREFYENAVAALGQAGATEFLLRLQDIAANPVAFETAVQSDVAQTSLFRTLSLSTITEQFRRILSGGPNKDEFTLTYDFPIDGEGRSKPMTFEVRPDSYPPTNVHVMIGSNGVGKTRTLLRMQAAFTDTDASLPPASYLRLSDSGKVAGVVSVRFSAFDPFTFTPTVSQLSMLRSVINVGLHSEGLSEIPRPMNVDELEDSFQRAFNDCLGDKRLRLEQVLSFVESDPLLSRLRVSEIDGLLQRLSFATLSSGHKIVLLTLVSLVAYVEEKTLVLIDEPETHLHPPLLAAFTRSLSWLLSDRNGIAIIATHSPVVLQEVPKKCVWKVWSSGLEADIERPDIETFGENVGTLTREVFKLEVAQSGYHRMLSEVAESSDTYDEAVAKFEGQLGEEAKMILRALMSQTSLNAQ